MTLKDLGSYTTLGLYNEMVYGPKFMINLVLDVVGLGL